MADTQVFAYHDRGYHRRTRPDPLSVAETPARMPELIPRLIENFRENKPVRAGSLIITIFGDAIAPHGGTVWLGSLIKLFEAFGLNQRLVRTSVFRLSQEGWLSAEQVGRRSYYSLTQSGRRRFESAFRRIYSAPATQWNGEWCLVFAGHSALGATEREKLRRELTWQGFGMLAPGVLGHPAMDATDILATLQEHAVQDKVVVMRAHGMTELGGLPLHELVAECWHLDELSQAYRDFLDRYRPILRQLQGVEALEPLDCLLVRTLLIHDYRRVLLRDPQLPDELLPADWAGTAARLLCRNLYRLTQEPAERYLLANLETADGPLPEAAPYFYNRFGGL